MISYLLTLIFVSKLDCFCISIGKNSVSLTRAPDMQQSSWHEKGSRGMLCI